MNDSPLRTAWSLVLLVFLLFLAHAGPLAADQREEAITRVGNDIRYLASDPLEGRGPGTEGIQKAAAYIREEFQRLGLKSGTPDGTYFQPFSIPMDTRVVPDQTHLILRGPDGQSRTLERGRDFEALAIGGAGRAGAELCFAGFGIKAPDQKYDDFAGVDMTGKIVVILRQEPQQGKADGAFQGPKTTPHAFIPNKLRRAKEAKAAAVLLVNDALTADQEKKDSLLAATGFGRGGLDIPFGQVTRQTLDQLLAGSPLTTAEGKELDSLAAVEQEIDSSLRPLSQPLAGWSADLAFAFETVRTEVVNVVGVLEGEGPLAGQSIVLGAHYDHLGFGGPGSRTPTVREVHNGADDNASGTAAIMELARRMVRREKPSARRLVFIAFTAEERGLLGSNHYLGQPLFPLNDTVAMLNYDMVGQLRNAELTIGSVGSGQGFSQWLDEIAASEADLKIKKMDGTVGASDHAGFYQRGVPCLHFFTGLTKEYHTPQDDFETINVAGVVRAVDVGEGFLTRLVAQPERPVFVKGPSRPVAGGMAYLGITPDYTAGVQGLRIAEVTANSPAAQGDLQAGDYIVQFGDAPIAELKQLMDGLRRNKPGDIVKVTVRRGEDTRVSTVTLGKPPGS